VRRLLALACACYAGTLLAQGDWLIISKSGNVESGKPFEVTVVAPPNHSLPAELDARMKVDVA